MTVETGVLVVVILCMQTVMGVVQPPVVCLCYSTGGGSPRLPCTTPGGSVDAYQNCAGDISLFLYYTNPNNAVPKSPSTVNNRFGACSCPARPFYRYAASPKNSPTNAYYDVGPSTPNTYFNISTCDEFGSFPPNTAYPTGNAAFHRANAVNCCRACCECAAD